MISTFDTVAVMLVVLVVRDLQPKTAPLVALGNGNKFRYIPAREIAAELGPVRV